jgi:hypothetical protein
MSIIRTILPFFVSLFLSSCNEVKPAYQFKDQPVSGMINSKEWTMVSGVARSSLTASDTLRIGLFDMLPEQDCSYSISETGILFDVPDREGIYRLKGSFTHMQSVTLYDGLSQFVALSGAIEISLIDRINGRLEGKIDATYDNKNRVNGVFTIDYCSD